MTTLTVNHLRVMRGQKSVVDDVSLRLETGRITALLGPNGAGKSSLVHVLAGLLPAAEGRIESDGASLVGQITRSDPRCRYCRRTGRSPCAVRLERR